MALSYYLANALLDHVTRNVAYASPATVHVALFTVMPAADGTGGTEVTGGSYARQAVTMQAAAAGVTTSTSSLSFPAMPAATVVGAGLFDAAAAGNLLYFGAFATNAVVAAATDFAVPAGDVVAVMR